MYIWPCFSFYLIEIAIKFFEEQFQNVLKFFFFFFSLLWLTDNSNEALRDICREFREYKKRKNDVSMLHITVAVFAKIYIPELIIYRKNWRLMWNLKNVNHGYQTVNKTDRNYTKTNSRFAMCMLYVPDLILWFDRC